MLEIIVATDQAGGFGKDGKIPWYHSEDLKHFKYTTLGGVCLMGRNTYVDMLEMRLQRNPDTDFKEILPNRLSFVITGSDDLETPGAIKAKSIDHALSMLDPSDNRRVFVIGGERMYLEALPKAFAVHRTIIPGYFECDRFFPVEDLHREFHEASVNIR